MTTRLQCLYLGFYDPIRTDVIKNVCFVVVGPLNHPKKIILSLLTASWLQKIDVFITRVRIPPVWGNPNIACE